MRASREAVVVTPVPSRGAVRILFVVGNFVAGGAERHLLEMWRA